VNLRAWHASDIGRVRDANEDRFFGSPERGCFVVCDGMGGHSAGEVAAQLGCDAVSAWYPAGDLTEATARRCVDGAAMAVVQAAQRARREGQPGADMGSTLVLLGLQDGLAVVAHAGDSRCYLLRGESLTLLTRDHSVVEEATQRGVHPELLEMMKMSQGNIVTNALGGGYRGATSMSMPTQPGDAFLLCSDRLHGMISDTDIGGVMMQWRDVDWDVSEKRQTGLLDVADGLVAAANAAGGKDNVTVCVVVV
jgi:protein phosphatase